MKIASRLLKTQDQHKKVLGELRQAKHGPPALLKGPDIAALRLRANQGDPTAQYSSGAIYWNGTGVPRDVDSDEIAEGR